MISRTALGGAGRAPVVEYLVCGAAFFLLAHDLGGKSIWMDEYYSLEVVQAPFLGMLQRVAADFHPPLYFSLLWGWARVAGTSEFGLRFPSSAVGCLGLALTMRLAHGLRLPGRVGRLAGLLLACSPAFGLYSRMARYFSLSLSLGLVSTLALLAAHRRNRPLDWGLYALTAALLLYTSYPAALLPGLHLLYTLAVHRRRWANHGLAILAAGLTYLPWLGALIRQVESTVGGGTDTASLPGLALRLAFPVYVFSVGETLFPWRPIAVAGLCVAVAAGMAGVWRAAAPHRWLVGLGGLAPIATTALLVAVYPQTTLFVKVPGRALFALPLLWLALAFGLQARAARIGRALTLAAAGLLLSADLMGWTNYLAGREFINVAYAVPSREVARSLAEDCRAGDVVLSPEDSVVHLYWPRPACVSDPYFTEDVAGSIALLEQAAPTRVFLVALGRDSTAGHDPAEVRAWLEQDYYVARSRGYQEQDEIYRRIKAWLLGYEAYRYRVTVDEYWMKPP